MSSVAAAATTSAISRLDRVQGALYGLLIADALAMPTHWYYGGAREIREAYGKRIGGYVAPNETKRGSIMSKSNTGGAGRGNAQGTVIGGVIFHDKAKYWQPGTSYHYHQGMSAGDNTLEALLTRRAVNVTAESGGKFDVPALTADYIRFMTTKGTHNDTYAGTCHRMFFANWAKGVSPKDCPGNDGHNVDTSDSLVATVPVALLAKDDAVAEKQVQQMVAITRRSKPSQEYARVYGRMLRTVAAGVSDARTAVATTARAMGLDLPSTVAHFGGSSDPMTA